MAAWAPYGNAVAGMARGLAIMQPMKNSAKKVGREWNQVKESDTLLKVEQAVKVHILVESHPVYHMPLDWAVKPLPMVLNQLLGALYAEMVYPEEPGFAQFHKQYLLLCVCFRLAWNEQVATYKEKHVANSMGFVLEKRGTFLGTRNKFIAYLQAPPPPIPPPPPMEMLGMHTLAAMAAAAAPPPPPPPPLLLPPPQQATPPPPPQPLGFTMDEAYAAIVEMEANGELAQMAILCAEL